jgi:hypothetical protein
MLPPSPQVRRLRRRIAVAPVARYLTPRKASGIKGGMTNALKTMAQMIALCGLCRWRTARLGPTRMPGA